MSRIKAPGPKPKLITGNLDEFKRDILGSCHRYHQEYGDIVRLRLGRKLFHLISSPELAFKVLAKENHVYVKTVEDPKNDAGLSLIMGNGLVMSYGKLWKRQRKLIHPIFQKKNISGYATLFEECVDNMLNRWDMEKLNSFDLSKEMTKVTLDMICRSMFHADLSSDANRISDIMTEAMYFVSVRGRSFWNPPLNWPTKKNQRFNHIMSELDEILYGLIDERLNKDVKEDDLLTKLILARDEETGEKMSRKELRDEVASIFVAGHETTANALTWTWNLLLNHPEIMKEVKDEANTVLSRDEPIIEKMNSLEFTTQVFEESLRLYPSVPMVARYCVQDTELEGYFLPKKSFLLVSFYNIHRSPSYWSDAESFQPERFSEKNKGRILKNSYIPFGLGPRSCLGNHLAIMEATLILAKVCQREILRQKDGHTPIPQVDITLRSKNGLQVLREI